MKKIVSFALVALCVACACIFLLTGCASGRVTDGAFSQGLMAVEQGGLWGYMDEKGEIVIDCKYDIATPFGAGHAAVSEGGRSYLIDYRGTDSGIELASAAIVISPDMKNIAVQDKNTALFGVIDSAGNRLVPAIYDDIRFTLGGLIVCDMGDVSELFDSEGKSLYPMGYRIMEAADCVALYDRYEDVLIVCDVNGRETDRLEGVTSATLAGGYVKYTQIASDGSEHSYLCGTAVDIPSSQAEIEVAYGSVYVLCYGEDTQSYAGTDEYQVYTISGLQVTERYDYVTVHPEIGYIGCFTIGESGSLTEGVITDINAGRAVYRTMTAEEINSFRLILLDGVSLDYMIEADGAIYDGDTGEVIIAPGEGESIFGSLAGNIIIEDGNNGFVKVVDLQGKVLFTTAAGETLTSLTGRDDYFFTTDTEGHMAMYNARTFRRVFGYDMRITSVNPASGQTI